MASTTLCLMLLGFNLVSAIEPRSDGLMEKLNNGMKFAKDFLGSESVALKVAEFVVRAFQGNNNSITNRKPIFDDSREDNVPEENTEKNSPYFQVHEAPSPMTPLRHLVKLFGLQPNQISAVAVNALVFVAQMISTFLSGPKRPSKPLRSDDPMSWILNKNSRKLQDLIAAAKNESLPDNIEDLIKQQDSDDETSCIRLLVCKITPYIVRMQKAVFNDDGKNGSPKTNQGAAVMYHYLPTQNEINEHSDICERRHRDCNIDSE